MCCSIILVFLALGSPEPLQAQENQKERITIQVKNQPIQKVFDDLSKQTGLKFFYGEAIANRNVQVNLKFKKRSRQQRIERDHPASQSLF